MQRQRASEVLTIVASQQEDVDELKTKDAQEVPRNAGHPARIHVLGLHTSLEHALEFDGDWEWEFHCQRLDRS